MNIAYRPSDRLKTEFILKYVCVAIVVIVGPITVGPMTAFAQQNNAQSVTQASKVQTSANNRAAELSSLIKDISLSQERINNLDEEVRQFARDRSALDRELITRTRQIQDLETKLSETEQKFMSTGVELDGLSASFEERKDQISELLIILQKMSRQPPPALLVAPKDALGAIRGSAMIAEMVPELREDIASLVKEIDRYAELQKQSESEREILQKTRHRQLEENQRLDGLINAKRLLEKQSKEALKFEREKVKKLAKKAKSLKELLSALEQTAYTATEESTESLETQRKSTVNQLAALNNPERLRSARPFIQLRGQMSLPVRGVVLSGYGDADKFGNISNGLTISARSGAQISAPADGWIRYAGQFRSYGNLLIIDVGQGYRLVLTGLEDISVAEGQFVLAGEPIGRLGEDRSRFKTGENFALVGTKPVLYLELRKDGKTIDSTKWWIQSQLGRASG